MIFLKILIQKTQIILCVLVVFFVKYPNGNCCYKAWRSCDMRFNIYIYKNRGLMIT